jgi:hypothetical protein
MRTKIRTTLTIIIYDLLYRLTLIWCIILCNTPCTHVIFQLTQCIYTPSYAEHAERHTEPLYIKPLYAKPPYAKSLMQSIIQSTVQSVVHSLYT